MADTILSVEEIIERMLTIFRLKWESERAKNYASLKAPLLVDEHFQFGNPTLIAQAANVVIYPEEEDQIDYTNGVATSYCCIMQSAIIHIRWYDKEHEQGRGHRKINQMGEVIKRMLIRNKLLVYLGSYLTQGLQILRITYGEQVSEAYEGNKVFYPTGDMLVRVLYAEHLEEDPA